MKQRRKSDEWFYKCIDGNWTYHPEAYCKARKGVLTKGLMKTHRCRERACMHLDDTVDFEAGDLK